MVVVDRFPPCLLKQPSCNHGHSCCKSSGKPKCMSLWDHGNCANILAQIIQQQICKTYRKRNIPCSILKLLSSNISTIFYLTNCSVVSSSNNYHAYQIYHLDISASAFVWQSTAYSGISAQQALSSTRKQRISVNFMDWIRIGLTPPRLKKW